jgi:hypothetical protein
MGLESNCPDGKEDRRTYFAVFMCTRGHDAYRWGDCLDRLARNVFTGRQCRVKADKYGYRV